MKSILRWGAVTAAVLLLLGCKETTSSEFIKTGGMAALISATAESDESSTVHVELRVGGPSSNNYVILRNGDKLSAQAGTETKALQAVSDGVYEGIFATGQEMPIVVALNRTDDTDAPASKALLPPPFLIATPQPTDTVSRDGQDLVISWDKVPGAQGTVDLDGSCIFSDFYDVSGDDGVLVIPKGETSALGSKKMESCNVEIKLTFARQGTPDPAFDPDSYFFTYQTRTVTFTSAP